MSIEVLIEDLRRSWRMGAIDEAGIARRFLDAGYTEDNAARLTRAVLKPYLRVLSLSDDELKKLLSLCAKELIPQLYHNAVDTELLSLMVKVSDALVAGIGNNGKKEAS